MLIIKVNHFKYIPFSKIYYLSIITNMPKFYSQKSAGGALRTTPWSPTAHLLVEHTITCFPSSNNSLQTHVLHPSKYDFLSLHCLASVRKQCHKYFFNTFLVRTLNFEFFRTILTYK